MVGHMVYSLEQAEQSRDVMERNASRKPMHPSVCVCVCAHTHTQHTQRIREMHDQGKSSIKSIFQEEVASLYLLDNFSS